MKFLGAFLLLAFAFTSACRPTTHDRVALLAGGSGEKSTTERPGDNFFVEDLNRYRDRLKARGWQVQEVLERQATNSNIEKAVRGTLESATPGKGEALIVLHTHGRERESQYGQRTHSIVTEDRDSSGYDPGFDLDALQPDLEAARKRGVRVALVDLSCYSGNSQKLKGVDCAITLATPRYVSLCSGRPEERLFPSHFLSLAKPGTPADLESTFLAARRQEADSVNVPQISSRTTPAGSAWDAFLFEVDPLDVFEDLRELRSGGAKPFDPQRLLKEIPTRFHPAIATKLQAVTQLRKELEADMIPLAKDYDEATLAIALPDREPLKLSPGSLAEMLEENPKTEGWSDAQKRLREALLTQRGALLKTYGHELQGFRLRREDFDRKTQELEAAASDLLKEERRLYDEESKPLTTACKEFVL